MIALIRNSYNSNASDADGSHDSKIIPDASYFYVFLGVHVIRGKTLIDGLLIHFKMLNAFLYFHEKFFIRNTLHVLLVIYLVNALLKKRASKVSSMP